MSLKLNTKYLEGFVSEHEYEGMAAQVTAAHNTLVNRNGLGNDFLGWVTLPEDYDKEEFARIKAAASAMTFWVGSIFLQIMTRKSSHASRSVQRKSRKILMYSL